MDVEILRYCNSLEIKICPLPSSVNDKIRAQSANRLARKEAQSAKRILIAKLEKSRGGYGIGDLLEL